MIKNLFNKIGGAKSGSAKDNKIISYEDAKNALSKQNKKDKKLLASRSETQPEILYYLATDKDTKIRRQVANNESTPIQADKLLCEDKDDEVRQELARKISRIFPDLPEEENNQVREQVIEILETLANDQLPGVRKILAEELKRSKVVPYKVVRKLAYDPEYDVCAPVLEYSPLLKEEDLREIIATTTVKGAVNAIAKREGISEETSEAIVNSLEVPAVASLLTNESSQIREDTLDAIIAQASGVEEWHEPLACRPNLSIRAIKRIASFVASALVHQMVDRHDLDKDIAKDLIEKARARIQDRAFDEDDQETLAKQAQDLIDKGVVDDEFIQNALDNKQKELVIQCLIIKSNMPNDAVRKILSSQKGIRVTSLAWRAGFSMRTALSMQSSLANVPPDKFMNAKDGTDFPVGAVEMEYELALYA